MVNFISRGDKFMNLASRWKKAKQQFIKSAVKLQSLTFQACKTKWPLFRQEILQITLKDFKWIPCPISNKARSKKKNSKTFA